ncbi:MAG: HlyD family secretion protein, partial [Defluviitaleaceae bacterium]|nr:HlyD family secretion protein [Defluviitaleaceae bacterium]
MNEYEMIEISGGNGNGKKPVNKKILIAIIVPIVLLVFIFLSGAIYNHNRPTVTAALPLRGHINHREVTSGIVRYAESAEIYAELTGWVERVLVREGDSVSIGQPILEIDFRTSPTDAQEQIDIIQAQMETARAQHRERMNGYRIDRQTAQVELERIISDISNAERRLAELRDEEFRPTSISDFNIRQKEEEIARARQMLYQTTTLFHAGIATGQEVDAAELALATAIENHNQLLLSFEESLENEYTRQRDWERDQENRIRDAENQLEAHRRARRTRDLNTESIGQREETARRQHDESLASYQRRLENYQRRLAGYEYSTILSPAEGIITNLNVNQGQHINANQLLVEIGLTQYFVVEGDIPLSNNFVTVGNSAVLRNASGTVTGNVTQVVPQENAKRVTIALDTTTNT